MMPLATARGADAASIERLGDAANRCDARGLQLADDGQHVSGERVGRLAVGRGAPRASEQQLFHLDDRLLGVSPGTVSVELGWKVGLEDPALPADWVRLPSAAPCAFVCANAKRVRWAIIACSFYASAA